MGQTDCRVQALANAKCLYGSEIEILTFSFETPEGTRYQTAVMKREDHTSPWVNMLHSKTTTTRAKAMRTLLEKTERDLAKHLARKGVTFPLTGDVEKGLEVTNMVRTESVISLSEASDGSEFEFVATPASSSAGDFSEDEKNEDDPEVEQPTIISPEAQSVATLEETPLQTNLPTVPVEISSENLDSDNHAINPVIEEHTRKSWGALNTKDQNRELDTETKEGDDHVETTKNTSDPTWDDWNWGATTKQKSKKKVTRKAREGDLKTEHWSAVVDEIEQLAKKKKQATNELIIENNSSTILTQESPATVSETQDDGKTNPPEVLPTSDQWSFWNIPQVKAKVDEQTSIAKHKLEATKSDDSLKVHQTLTEWMSSGIPAEKINKLQDLIESSSSPKRASSAPASQNVVGEISDPKSSKAESSNDQWAIWTASFDEVEEKKDAKSQKDSSNDNVIPSIPQMAPLAMVAAKSAFVDVPDSQTLPGAWPASSFDSWGAWPLPAKKKKIMEKTQVDFPEDMFTKKSESSNTNPWAERKDAKKGSFTILREPEAILDEYDSSKWGRPKMTQQKTLTKDVPSAVSVPKFGQLPIVQPFPIQTVDVTRKKSHRADQVLPKSELAAAMLFTNPHFSQYQGIRKHQTTPSEPPKVKTASNDYNWSQNRWEVPTTNSAQSPVPVLLSEPEPIQIPYHTQAEKKPKNPFEVYGEPSTERRPDIYAADKEVGKWGLFGNSKISRNHNNNQTEVSSPPKALEAKISPWPYLEPETQTPATASVSQQSLLDELAEWGSFSNKEKKKKPVAFDYLEDDPPMAAPMPSEAQKEPSTDALLDTDEWAPFGSNKKLGKKNRRRRMVADENSPEHGVTVRPPGNDLGFGNFVIKNKSEQVDASADLEWEAFHQKRNAARDSSTVSEMPGDNLPATTPIPSVAQTEYHTNILGRSEDSEPDTSAWSLSQNAQRRVSTIQQSQIASLSTPQLRVYVLDITYRHALRTEHFQDIMTVSFANKAAIVAEINKFISPREPFGQIYKRKIEILSAKGQDGQINLSALDEMSWPDILGFLEDTTPVIEMDVVVSDV